MIWVWRHVPLPFLLIGGAVLLSILLVIFAPTITPKPQAEKVWAIRAQAISPGPVQPDIEQYGELRSGRTIDLRSYVTGEIIHASDKMQEGSIVKTGDVLVRIDPFDYEKNLIERRSQLQEAQATYTELEAQAKAEAKLLAVDKTQLDLIKKDYNRAQTLRKSGTVSEKFLDNAQTAYNQQIQQFTNRETQLKILQARLLKQKATTQRLAAARDRAERDLQRSVIKAPFDGFLSDVTAEQHKRVGANEKIARLADVSRLEVRFTLTNDQYSRLQDSGESLTGRPVIVYWDIGGNTKSYEAILERVGGQIDPRTGGIDAYARLTPQPLTTTLRPGAFVRVSLKDRLYDNALIVPLNTVYEKSYVFVVKDGRLSRLPVTILGQSGDNWIIQGNFNPGDILMTERLSEAGDGIRVEVR